jgi:hypothetical protein
MCDFPPKRQHCLKDHIHTVNSIKGSVGNQCNYSGEDWQNRRKLRNFSAHALARRAFFQHIAGCAWRSQASKGKVAVLQRASFVLMTARVI